ncbi:hypothetical protein M2271_005339 [Streptomyces sp. LBL]|nr:hypothetical protein [Streptomyces sp. LBL]
MPALDSPSPRHEGRLWLRTVLAAAVACALLQGAIWYVGARGDVSSLRAFQWTALRTAGIHGLVALGYLVRPKKAPTGTGQEPRPTSPKEEVRR